MRLSPLVRSLPLAGAVALPAAAQTAPDTGYIALPEAREIALARSAAPAAVSAEATIWVVRDGTYRVAVAGTNDNHCFVARTWARSLEPVCYDAEGARTVLPLEIRRFDLRRQGLTPPEVDAAVEAAIGRGELALPQRPAMSYMMSSAQELINERGQRAGNWKPHLMLYWPYVTHGDLGLPDGPTDEVIVVDEGTPQAYVVIVVPAFVDPKPTP